MGMDPTGSTESHLVLVLIPVILDLNVAKITAQVAANI